MYGLSLNACGNDPASLRTIARLIGIVGISATLLLGFTASAQAQGTDNATFVDNLGQTSGGATGKNAYKYAQTFTTGAREGYILQSIQTRIDTLPVGGGTLTFNSSPNYENPVDADGNNVYEITSVVSDGFSADSVDVTVTVTDEPAGNGLTAVQYAENGTGTVETYTTSETVTWSLEGADSSAFNISTGGALSFASPPDYENPADADTDNVDDITVVATDGSEPSRLDVSVSVTGVNEAPPADPADVTVIA